MNHPTPSPAELYEGYFVPAMFLPWASALLGEAALKQGELVLDVACGTGVVAREAAALVGVGGSVTAIDRNPEMVALARSLPEALRANVDWHVGDAAALPFSNAVFDVVLCQHALPFFPDRVAATREMRRVLKPGGRALGLVLQGVERHAVFETLMGCVARELSVPVAAVQLPFALSNAAELGALYTTAGFGDVRIAPASIIARFPDAARFVPLAVASSAAAIPAFAQLSAPARAALVETIRAEVAPVVERHTLADVVQFPMFAHLVVARG